MGLSIRYKENNGCECISFTIEKYDVISGYPIRHTYLEFVDRYRFLISGCPPSHKIKVKTIDIYKGSVIMVYA
jgi:hypothetical protein